MKTSLRILLLLVLGALLMSACSPSSGAELRGTQWNLIMLNVDGREVDLTTPNPVTLEINEKGETGGSAGCNHYFATAEFKSGGKLEISEVGSTEMYCDLGMEVETAYLGALAKVESWSMAGNADTLTFNGPDGDPVLVFSKQP